MQYPRRGAIGEMSEPLAAEVNGRGHAGGNWRTVIGLGLIAFAVLVTYGNTLRSEFIHDDTAEILQNPFVRDLSHIREIFTSAAWTFGGAGPYQLSSNYYRPIQYLSYAVLYRFFGPKPWGYHLYKLLSHLAVCCLVFWILWRWWQDYRIALFSSLLFAVHPANTEAVSWVSGITDTTCALFFLLSLLVYLQDRSQPSNLRLLLLSFLFLGGMLSKETMVTFLGVILVYEWLETGRFPRLKEKMRVVLPLTAVFAVYLALRINAIGAFTNPRQVQFRFDFLNWFQILLNQLILLSKYVVLFFVPVRLNAHHLYDPVTSPFSYPFGLAFLILTASFLGIRLLLKSLKPGSRGLLLVGSVWFPMVLLPVIIFFKQLGENVFTERYIYLPSIGLCISVCLALTLANG
jgi:protein O-mannosyl-transferase